MLSGMSTFLFWENFRSSDSEFGDSNTTSDHEHGYNSQSMTKRIFCCSCVCTRGNFRRNGYFELGVYGCGVLFIGVCLIFGYSSILRLILSKHYIIQHQVSYSLWFWIGIIAILGLVYVLKSRLYGPYHREERKYDGNKWRRLFHITFYKFH